MKPSTVKPSPALIVAMIALVAALAGTATALPGKGSVEKNDLAKGAVTKKAIKKGAVTKKAIKSNAVTGKAIADGSVTEAEIAAREAAHVVGDPGEPAFSNGGEGDCVWRNIGADEGVSGSPPVGFYRDQLGFVHLQGIAVVEDGPGGDGDCNPNGAGEIEDGVAFTLPDEYAPKDLFTDLSLGGVSFVVPLSGATFETLALPPGTVFGAGTLVLLDGTAYEPGSAESAAAKPATVDLDRLEGLAR